MGTTNRYVMDLALLFWSDLLLSTLKATMVCDMVGDIVGDLIFACDMVQLMAGLGDRIAIAWEGTIHPPFPVSQLRVN